MFEKITLDKLKEELTFFHRMYDIVRIVDPVEKCVLEWDGSKLNLDPSNEMCYAYWKSGLICDNCISIRAEKENNSFVKLEINSEVVMLVTAIPIETTDRPIVLELLKNATETMMIGNGDYNEGHKLINVVSKMNDMIVKDSLTTVYNRRFIDERLPVDIIKATIEQTPLSLIFIDIDNLKNINDTYGHRTGDIVVKETGKALQGLIRADNDWVGRFGGDEFVVVLKDTSHKAASIIADRIHNTICNTKVSTKNKEIPLGISFGLHTMHNTQLTSDELISLADKDMYKAKRIKRTLDMGK